jgi:hypothetical protein
MEGARFYARLVYALRPGERDISARLNGSVAQAPGPVATYATYVLPAGGEQILTVRGPAARVRFDPGPFDAVRDFLVRALDAFLLGGGHLLFLACLLLPALGAREAASLFAAVAAGQGATMTASVLFPLPETAVVSLGMIGMSAVVIAGIQAIVGARFFLVLPVAILFGLANGFVFGAEINAAEPFAGSQHSIAAVTYIVTVLAGTLWLGAVGWLARDWLEKAGYFPRLVMLFLSVVLIHSALHRMIEAERQLAGAPGDISSVALWLTLGWVGACLLAGLAGGSLVGAQEAKS